MHDLFAYAREHDDRAHPPRGAGEQQRRRIALYEQLGFTRFNVRERYYADGEDAIEMLAGPSPHPASKLGPTSPFSMNLEHG